MTRVRSALAGRANRDVLDRGAAEMVGPAFARSARGGAVPRLAALVAALLLASGHPAAAQSVQPIVMPLSDPSRPAVLEASLMNGRILVRPHDAAEIVIAVRDEDEQGEEASGARDADGSQADGASRDGLRRIPTDSMGLTAEERDNTVSVIVDPRKRPSVLEISVPRRTSVKARMVNGGDLRVEGVTGEHELTNVNGAIFAADIAGSAVVSTTNGDVEVSFTEVTPGKPMSFTSFNGDVVVSFPPTLAANLRIDSARGEVLTNFDVEVRPQTPVVDRSDAAGRRRVRLERDVLAVVGGGGAEIELRTFNGDIEIRRSE